tara:strand:- start:948 stop:1139 length:192 start_codon:yes stop_codon:yes gene_type:complete
LSYQLTQFVLRLQKKISDGKSIQLSPDELDLFVAYGGYRSLALASVDQLEREAKERIEAQSKG